MSPAGAMVEWICVDGGYLTTSDITELRWPKALERYKDRIWRNLEKTMGPRGQLAYFLSASSCAAKADGEAGEDSIQKRHQHKDACMRRAKKKGREALSTRWREAGF